LFIYGPQSLIPVKGIIFTKYNEETPHESALGSESKTIRNFITFISLFYSNPAVLVIPLDPHNIKYVTKAKSTVNCGEHYESHNNNNKDNNDDDDDNNNNNNNNNGVQNALHLNKKSLFRSPHLVY